MKKILAGLILCVPAFLWAQTARNTASASKYTQDNYFRVSLPAGWQKDEQVFGMTQEEKKIYGVDVYGPANADKIMCRISVHYYGPSNVLHKTPEKFIQIHAKPVFGVNLDGKKYGKVESATVGRRGARVFERITYEYEPPNSLHPKKVAVYERFAVIPLSKGYYVLRYYAPKEIAKDNMKAFEGVLASFEPLVK